MSRTIKLRALDGANPLAFLAAMGTLRLLHLQSGSKPVRMRWTREAAWLPEIQGFDGTEEDLCDALMAAPRVPLATLSLLGKNLTVEAPVFAAFARACAQDVSPIDRRGADFAVAFGNELCEDKGKERIDYTDFCFITGSGHQHFIGTMETLTANVTSLHILDSLFGHWHSNEGSSMRWDPLDAAEYSLRWKNPGKEGASAVWGANLLAIEGLPMFPAQPGRHRLRTGGFFRPKERGSWPQFTWPIWADWIGLDTVRSLLSLKELCNSEKDLPRECLRERGISEIFRSQRVRIGQGANFKVSFRPSRAI